jgi:hypothetical protein
VTRKPKPFPNWVPELARSKITELRADPATDKHGLDLLRRLATSSIMRTEVWEKLSEPGGFEGQIVGWAFLAYTIFPRLRRPYPDTRVKAVKWGKHLNRYKPLTDYLHLAQQCRFLLEDIFTASYETDRYWAQYWEGPPIDPGQMRTMLGNLGLFYANISAEQKNFLDSLPQISRYTAKGHQKFFTECLSREFLEATGRPHDSVVAALASVAFDLPQAVTSETVRGRRRPS